MDTERKNEAQPDVDISALRKTASGGETPRFWRGLDELADTPEFRNHKENEFPHGANDPEAKLDRRDLLKVMAASAALITPSPFSSTSLKNRAASARNSNRSIAPSSRRRQLAISDGGRSRRASNRRSQPSGTSDLSDLFERSG